MALHTSRGPRRGAAALLSVGVLLLAGCGSDGTAGSEAARAPAAAAAPTTGEAEPGPAGGATASPGPAPDVTTAAPTTDPASTSTSATAGGGTVSAAPEAAAEQHVITIVDFAYEVPASVPPGATVTVVNDDSAAHTVTSGGDFDVAVTIGATATFTAPQEPGEYTIVCLHHGNMTATLVVA